MHANDTLRGRSKRLWRQCCLESPRGRARVERLRDAVVEAAAVVRHHLGSRIFWGGGKSVLRNPTNERNPPSQKRGLGFSWQNRAKHIRLCALHFKYNTRAHTYSVPEESDPAPKLWSPGHDALHLVQHHALVLQRRARVGLRQGARRMRGVKHGFGMRFTHEGRLTPKLERPNTRGRLEQVLGNWEESEQGGGFDGPHRCGRSSSARSHGSICSARLSAFSWPRHLRRPDPGVNGTKAKANRVPCSVTPNHRAVR